MIDIILFSHNNPQMLYLTLKSLEKNYPNSKVNIVFSYTDMNISKGYSNLMHESNSNLTLYWHPSKVKSVSFKDNVLNIIATITSKELIFLTDGDVLFEKFDYKEIERNLNKDNVLCHSLRLGLNTTTCFRMKCENVIKAEEDGDSIFWNWTKHYLDFGYPFSLHGHVFNTKEIKKLIKKIRFEQYSEIEEGLQMFEHYPKEIMTSFKKSKSIFMPYDSEDMTIEDFLNGYVPDFNSMDFSKIEQCEGNIWFENIKKA